MLNVLAEPKVREDDPVTILTDEDVGRLEVPVDNDRERITVSARLTEAVEVGEGTGDLGGESNSQFKGDGCFYLIMLNN